MKIVKHKQACLALLSGLIISMSFSSCASDSNKQQETNTTQSSDTASSNASWVIAADSSYSSASASSVIESIPAGEEKGTATDPNQSKKEINDDPAEKNEDADIDASVLSYTYTRQDERSLSLSFTIPDSLGWDTEQISYRIDRTPLGEEDAPVCIAEESITFSEDAPVITVEDWFEEHEEVIYTYTLTVFPVGQEEKKIYSSIPASTILICVDPGHTYGENTMTEGEHRYCEGEFSLQVSEVLMESLKTDYGISTYSTRDPSLGGSLDHVISPRGEYAAGSDLFFSIHTNANNENANGFPTQMQPIGIMKTLVIANDKTRDSEIGMTIANAVGKRLSAVNYAMGIAETSEFETRTGSDCLEWTEVYNDSLGVNGTVVQRTEGGQEYYGVLLGSSTVGVKGMIVEHGFHTVDQMREAAQERDLAGAYGRADAAGIAEGFGIAASEEETAE
ncbi:MAG: N-acetylmuramoyl-L-alanine amidase [Eubacteriales bacterium]|nr:N-acetylmuramoyl-L-alanine amidase [Eubacteriales bacterium]